MWTNREMARLANGQHTDEEKRMLNDVVSWWQDVIFALRVMANDAPVPSERELMNKIIGHLERRNTAILVGLTKN